MIRVYKVRRREAVTVNKPNPQAVGLYRHMGVEVYRRTDCDEEGGPYFLIALPFFLSFLFLRLRQRFLDAGSAAAGRFVFFHIAVIHICHRVHSLSYIKITFLIIAGFCQRNRKNPFFL